MRTARMLETGFALALALAWGATLGAGRALADSDRHDRKREHGRSHREVVVRHEHAPRDYGCAPMRAREVRREHIWVSPRPVYRHVVVRPAPPPPRLWVPVCRTPVVRPHRVYDYYDPYCGERFASLTIYVEHLQHHRHLSFAWAMEFGNSQPLYGCRYDEDRWVRWEADDD